MKIEKLTLYEFAEKKKKYFSEKGNENVVIKCVSPDGYQFWMKHKTIADVAKIYYNYEPYIRREFSSENEIYEHLKSVYPDGIAGTEIRWLHGKFIDSLDPTASVCLQPYMYHTENTAEEVEYFFEASIEDSMFGMLMDPYVYIGEFNEQTDDDVNEELYQDLNNYNVFIVEMTPEEYDKQEKDYIDSYNGHVFDDGLIRISENRAEETEFFKNFIRENTHYNI